MKSEKILKYQAWHYRHHYHGEEFLQGNGYTCTRPEHEREKKVNTIQQTINGFSLYTY